MQSEGIAISKCSSGNSPPSTSNSSQRKKKKKKNNKPQSEQSNQVHLEEKGENSKPNANAATNNPSSKTSTLKKKRRKRNKNNIKEQQTNEEKKQTDVKETLEKHNTISLENTLESENKGKSTQDPFGKHSESTSHVLTNIELKKKDKELPSTMENPAANTKSREAILADREAKKLMKETSKLNSPKTNSGTSSQQQNTPVVNNNTSGLKSPPSIAKSQVKEKDAPKSRPSESNSIPKIEKSREEILAEREAKRLAKQAAKQKVKDPSKTDNSTKSEDTKPEDRQNETKCVITNNIETENNVTKNLESKMENLKVEGQSKDQVPTSGEKKTTTKAERRALQEAQRAAKAKLVEDKDKLKVKNKQEAVEIKKIVLSPRQPAVDEKKKVQQKFASGKPEYKVKLFSHLKRRKMEENISINNQHIHPAIMQLGSKYSERTIVGANARCVAFLNALKPVIQDYETPPKKEFTRGLEATIKNCVEYLDKCRPLAVSVNNAYKHIKMVLTTLNTDRSETELKKDLVEIIDKYIDEQIEKAAQGISLYIQEKISDGDVILTYGCSSLINHILEVAHERKVKFRVIVVDSKPFMEGQELLRRLVMKGIDCTCVLINAVGFIMSEVTKILLGAHAILANGYVMARAGTAQVALVGRSFNVPVLVCCETHKFSERVQTDAIVYNEIGDPNDLIPKNGAAPRSLENWQSYSQLYPLNLNYDVTPPELVTAVVTEVAILPCTSVPVILRIRPSEVGY